MLEDVLLMMCSRYRNGGQMYGRLHGRMFETVDSFQYLGWQVATDGGCDMDVVHRMNEG